jgi:hypothetical protein
MNDHPITSTRVIAVPQPLPDAKPPGANPLGCDYAVAASPGPLAVASGHGQADTVAPPGQNQLVALVRLLARQAAREDLSSQVAGG